MENFKSLHIILYLLLIFLINQSIGARNINDSYRESLDMHVGRTVFVAGESIFFKVYGTSNSGEVLSQAYYVELVDHQNRHVSGQILHPEDKVASSALRIPDTLATGHYRLVSYTSYMRNFPDSYFASHPIFVYNKYDTEESKTKVSPVFHTPDFYLEHGQLIAGVSNKVTLHFPAWFQTSRRAGLYTDTGGSPVLEFEVSNQGLASFSFVPSAGIGYEIRIQGEASVRFRLPETQSGRAVMHVSYISDSSALIRFERRKRDGELSLQLYRGIEMDQVLAEKKILPGHDSISIPFKDSASVRYTFLLIDAGGNRIDKKLILRTDPNLPVNQYTTNEQVFIPQDKLHSGHQVESASLAVYKLSPDQLHTITENIGEKKMQGYMSEVAPKTFLFLEKWMPAGNLYPHDPLAGFRYPVEDIGIIYTGRVWEADTYTPSPGISVVLAMQDTLPTLMASVTDSSGRFVFLRNDFGSRGAYIDMYKNGVRQNGNLKFQLVSKFHYLNINTKSTGTPPVLNSEESSYLENEADRVVIQRAFGHLTTIEVMQDTVRVSDRAPFYGKPGNVVYPEIFFELPNFEEIAREILPRVRYNKNKKGCTITVVHIENGTRSGNPLLLHDGVPVRDVCEVYPLNSDDIQRVEIQSGLRVSGNLLYEGLVALYATPEYRMKEKDDNKRPLYPIVGYHKPRGSASMIQIAGEEHTDYEPDFRNQLYWNASYNWNLDTLRFLTSDETGAYVVDFKGYTMSGEMIHTRWIINVENNQEAWVQ